TLHNSSNGTITAAALTVTGVTAADKVYDGTTDATIDFSSAALSGVVSGDRVNLDTSAPPTGTFANKNAGTGKTVTTSGFAINGADSNNYSLTQRPLQASITPNSIDGSFTAADKYYDGTAA